MKLLSSTIFRFDYLKNMRLTISQNALHFGMKYSKLPRFLGLRPPPPCCLRQSQLCAFGACNFPDRLPYLYAKNSYISACPESTPRHLQHLDFFHLQYVPLLKIPLKYALTYGLLVLTGLIETVP